jgi:hypothetical protein
MSNPVATIGNNIPVPADPEVVRTTFTKIVYDAQKFSVYGEDEYDPAYSSFDPSNRGDEFYMFIPLDNALVDGGSAGVKPDFVSYNAWDGLKLSASGFITAVNSVMPKIIIPTEILVDNGLVTENHTSSGMYSDGTAMYQGLFNWELVTLNDIDISDIAKTFEYAQIGAYNGSLYVSSKAKNDASSTNVMKIKLRNPTELEADPPGLPAPPLGSD